MQFYYIYTVHVHAHTHTCTYTHMHIFLILPSYRLYASVDVVIWFSWYPFLSHSKTPCKSRSPSWTRSKEITLIHSKIFFTYFRKTSAKSYQNIFLKYSFWLLWKDILYSIDGVVSRYCRVIVVTHTEYCAMAIRGRKVYGNKHMYACMHAFVCVFVCSCVLETDG
jgi:hypothetical protein